MCGVFNDQKSSFCWPIIITIFSKEYLMISTLTHSILMVNDKMTITIMTKRKISSSFNITQEE